MTARERITQQMQQHIYPNGLTLVGETMDHIRLEIVIRDGPWKLFDPNGKKNELVELYNIEKDEAKKTYLAAKNPEIVTQFKAKLAKWSATLPKEYSKVEDKD